jgi:hypothetical protein
MPRSVDEAALGRQPRRSPTWPKKCKVTIQRYVGIGGRRNDHVRPPSVRLEVRVLTTAGDNEPSGFHLPSFLFPFAVVDCGYVGIKGLGDHSAQSFGTVLSQREPGYREKPAPCGIRQ